MANDDKTEKPTGKRKSEARKKGQVAKSTEVNGALVLVAGLVAISMQGPAVVNSMAGAMRTLFGMVSRPNESGITSSSSQSSPPVRLPASTLAWIAAPSATTWSGSRSRRRWPSSSFSRPTSFSPGSLEASIQTSAPAMS